ncbi:MAG: hypothetical protein LBD94_00630, partial [Rickettsiales bacterium]|nr:hypothetical protein [Rickettsiales bacterium]
MSKILAVFVALFVSAAGSAFADVADALIPSGNLTSFQNQQGMVNNNQYNQMIVRTSGSSGGGAATADFGNCNALIQRCATPKCGNGGCTDMGIATPIVAGCVAASSECKKHGDALVQFIAAQIVASNQVKANNAAAAQQQALTAQQAQQSQQQIEQMNAQMQQIQQQMAAQQAQSAQQMQEALAAQQAQTQALLEQQQQAAAAAQQQVSSVISAPADMEAAIDRGVDADVIARQQIIGQVMSSLDGVDDGLNSLKKIVEDLRTYSNCDYSIAKCEGPK